jgi:fatty-acid desaturase
VDAVWPRLAAIGACAAYLFAYWGAGLAVGMDAWAERGRRHPGHVRMMGDPDRWRTRDLIAGLVWGTAAWGASALLALLVVGLVVSGVPE